MERAGRSPPLRGESRIDAPVERTNSLLCSAASPRQIDAPDAQPQARVGDVTAERPKWAARNAAEAGPRHCPLTGCDGSKTARGPDRQLPHLHWRGQEATARPPEWQASRGYARSATGWAGARARSSAPGLSSSRADGVQHRGRRARAPPPPPRVDWDDRRRGAQELPRGLGGRGASPGHVPIGSTTHWFDKLCPARVGEGLALVPRLTTH